MAVGRASAHSDGRRRAIATGSAARAPSRSPRPRPLAPPSRLAPSLLSPSPFS